MRDGIHEEALEPEGPGIHTFRRPRWFRHLFLFQGCVWFAMVAKEFARSRPSELGDFLWLALLSVLGVAWLLTWLFFDRRFGPLLQATPDRLTIPVQNDTRTIAWSDLVSLHWQSPYTICFLTRGGQEFIVSPKRLGRRERKRLYALLEENLDFYSSPSPYRTRSDALSAP